MQVHARLSQLRMSPRKVRLILGLIRGQRIPAAVRQLEFAPQAAARPVLKLLKSAMANAEHNFNADPSTFRVIKVTADGGPVLSRWQQKAFGRATPIRKRTSHIHIVIGDETIADAHKKSGVGSRESGVKETKKDGAKKAEKKVEKIEKKTKTARAAKPRAAKSAK
jgi:large subunit ribosomal protein L22